MAEKHGKIHRILFPSMARPPFGCAKADAIPFTQDLLAILQVRAAGAFSCKILRLKLARYFIFILIFSFS